MVVLTLLSFFISVQAGITVDAERLRLSEVYPHAPSPWSDLDLGAAPAPGQAMWLEAGAVHRSVANAQLEPLPVRIPRRIRITRASQRIDEVLLRDMVHSALDGRVDGAALQSITVRGGILMPRGAVYVDLDPPAIWRDGQQTIMANLRSAHGRTVAFPVTVQYHSPHKRGQALVQRGSTVTIRLHQGTLLLEAAGVAQENGERDAVIAVLPVTGSKMLRARVVDARYVEVSP